MKARNWYRNAERVLHNYFKAREAYRVLCEEYIKMLEHGSVRIQGYDGSGGGGDIYAFRDDTGEHTERLMKFERHMKRLYAEIRAVEEARSSFAAEGNMKALRVMDSCYLLHEGVPEGIGARELRGIKNTAVKRVADALRYCAG